MRTQRHREAESCQVGEVRDTHEAAAREHHIRAVGIIIKAGSTPMFFPRALSPGLRGSQELVGCVWEMAKEAGHQAGWSGEPAALAPTQPS